MRVALLHHARLPVVGYGGTERVVVWLARGLAERGHEVILLAAPGSAVPEARVIPLDPRRFQRWDADPRPLLPSGVDILHAHQPLQPVDGLPVIWTLHGHSRPGERLPGNMICVSASHAARYRAATHVANGLDPADYQFRAVKQAFDLFLGRLHSVKGHRWAIEGARRSGRRLVVAGGWRPSLRRGVRYVGRVGGRPKRELLANAGCLWMPVQWEEPFGLVTIEALVSGTPVLATPRGALPEILTDEVGAMGETVDQLVHLRPRLDRIDPAACRAHVEDRFSHRVMAEAYERVYRRFLSSGSLVG